MTWRPADCHAHTTMSDGMLSVPELIEHAAARGVRPGISDHVSRDLSLSIKSVEETRVYLDVLERYDVLRGAEFCWHDSLWRELPESLVRRFTHRLGSVHAVTLPNGSLLSVFSAALPLGLTPDTYMDAHIVMIEQCARSMPVDILAHPTAIPPPLRHRPPEEVWTEDREQRVVDALFAAGIAFEISARYRPHERIVRRAVERGVRMSLGSDGHTSEQVGDLAFPRAVAAACGVAEEDLYDPERHGSRRSAAARSTS